MSTIAAISTAPGNAGIGIIRLSVMIALKFCKRYLSLKIREK